MAKTSPLRKLYRISMVSAFFVSLPALILAGWIVADSYLEYRRFSTIACRGKAPCFNIDIMHLYLKNALKRASIRAVAPGMPSGDRLPLVQMSIDRESLSDLNSDLPESGKSKYNRAYVNYSGKSHTVKARYMGDNHWHWLYPQKSWRVKTKKSKLIEGSRKLNFKNPRSIITFNECVAQDLAKDIGLIAPRVYPVKFVLNNTYQGVYLFWEPIDESVIRRFDKMPGSIYSGDGAAPDPNSGISLLWKEEKWWRKVASRNSEQENDRDDLKGLLHVLNKGDLKDFYLFANKHLDKDAFASFFSLDNVTACMHHDYNHNHKLYFDPISGKILPISWDIDEWHLGSRKFDVATSPLLNKWKLIPEFELLRQKRLFGLIDSGDLSLDKIHRKMDDYDERIRPALEADIYKDYRSWKTMKAFKFVTPPCEPFTMEQYNEKVRLLKEQIGNRISMLRNFLDESKMACSLIDCENDRDAKIMKIVVDGNVGRVITGVKLSGSAGSVTMLRDINRNGSIDKEDRIIGKSGRFENDCFIPVHEEVLPGYKKSPLQTGSRFLFGDYELEPSPLVYDYILETRGGTVTSVEIHSENIITRSPMTTDYVPLDNVEQIGKTASLHPWDLSPEPEKNIVTLGPETVTLHKSTIYGENTLLTIFPGTTIQLAEGASIFCYGKVIANGSPENPIRFVPLDPKKPWGAFCLKGSEASGSIFVNCVWENGSIAKKDLIDYYGMVSVHDVDDLVIRNCTIGHNYFGDDAVRLAYSDNFTVEGCLFLGCRSDALDVDISKGQVVSTRFSHSGNDALDLMTSKVKIRGCLFENAGDKGVSIGEKSEVVLDRSVFENCKIGVEVKDRSVLDFRRNFIRGSAIAINLYRKNWRYGAGGILEADVIYVKDCGKNVKADKHSKAEFTRIDTSNPDLLTLQKVFSSPGISAPNPGIN